MIHAPWSLAWIAAASTSHGPLGFASGGGGGAAISFGATFDSAAGLSIVSFFFAHATSTSATPTTIFVFIVPVNLPCGNSSLFRSHRDDFVRPWDPSQLEPSRPKALAATWPSDADFSSEPRA